MIILVKAKISGQLRFEIPKEFVDRDFWLNVDGTIYVRGEHFEILDGSILLNSPSYSPMLISTIYFTDE